VTFGDRRIIGYNDGMATEITIDLDDELWNALKDRAYINGASFNQTFNQVLREGLRAGSTESEQPPPDPERIASKQ
jgi:hypothetical protein